MPKAPKHGPVIVSQRLVAINAASSLVAKLLSATVLFWMYQYLLKRISPEEFAVYPVLMAGMAFAPLFFSVLTGGVSRHIVAAYARDEGERVAEITSSIVPLIAAASAAFLIGGLVVAAFVDDILKIAPEMVGEAQLMLALLVVSYALQMVMLPFSTGFHVRQRFVELNAIGVSRELLRIVLLITFLVGIGPSVLWVVVAGVLAEQVHLAAVLFRSRRLVPEARFERALFRWGTARELVSFGLWTTVGQLANVLVMSAGTLVLNEFGTALDVTVYYLGATLFRQIQSVIGLAASPLLPALTAMHSHSDRERLARTALRGGRYGLWVALAVACPLAVYSSSFVELYLGPGYESAGAVIRLFMIIFVFGQPTSLLPMIAMAMASVRDYNVGAFVTALAGFGLSLYLVSVEGLGARGVAISLLAVTAVSELLYFWPLQLRLVGARRRNFVVAVLARGLLPAAIGTCAWWTLGVFYVPETWLSLILLSTAGGTVYLLTLVLVCLDRSERTNLRRALSGVLS